MLANLNFHVSSVFVNISALLISVSWDFKHILAGDFSVDFWLGPQDARFRFKIR